MSRLALVALALCIARPAAAQSDRPNHIAFGFSGVSYQLEPADAVYTDPEAHLSGNVGFRLTKGAVVVQYINGPGISQTWSDIMAARAQQSGSGDVQASVPGYREVSTAAMFGISYDFGGMFRLALDYIPIFMTPTRNSYRLTFGLAG